MRILRINGVQCDIDDQTTIGIDIQGYDIRTPGVRKLNVSNTFSIPKTAKNWNIIGMAGNIFSDNSTVYDPMTCTYVTGGNLIYNNDTCRIVSIAKNRINCLVVQKYDFIDQLKEIQWKDFILGYLDWQKETNGLIYNKNISEPLLDGFDPPVDIPNAVYYPGLFSDFIEPFTKSTSGIVLPAYVGNLNNYITKITQDNVTYEIRVEDYALTLCWSNWAGYDDNAKQFTTYSGGHFCVYIKSFFEYIEYLTGVNLGVSDVFQGNIFSDIVLNNIVHPVYGVVVRSLDFEGGNIFLAYSNKYLSSGEELKGKTVSDMFSSFCQIFNIVIDKIDNNTYKLFRFDDIKLYAETIDWSGVNIDSIIFNPIIEGIAQNNLIKYAAIYEDGADNYGGKTIICDNKNIDKNATILEVKAYAPRSVQSPFTEWRPDSDRMLEDVLDMSTEKCMSNFTFLYLGGYTQRNVAIQAYPAELSLDDNYIILSHETTLRIAKVYSLESEYQQTAVSLLKPKLFEVTKWLTPDQINKIKYFQLYYIKELGGSFFLNKISGFNPDESKEPTRVELLWLSDRSPGSETVKEYWKDGAGVIFTDGAYNKFY